MTFDVVITTFAMFFEANKRKQKYNRLLKLWCVKLMKGNRKQKKYQKSHPSSSSSCFVFLKDMQDNL
jgi:hypothetical protein